MFEVMYTRFCAAMQTALLYADVCTTDRQRRRSSSLKRWKRRWLPGNVC